MSRKQTPIRVFGQRSIASSFRTLPPNSVGSDNSKANERNQASRESTLVSLSDFLHRKLQRSSGIHGKVQAKATPFLSPLGLRVSTVGDTGTKKQCEEETKSINDKVIFERFKHTDQEKGEFISPYCDEGQSSVVDDVPESRKRKNPFEVGRNEVHTVRKHVVVLGAERESKFRQNGRTENYSGNKKPKPLYNHYKNGSGWWDSNMEGVDDGEVGFSEVWEGVGSSSLGGIIDWH